jgi:maltooligosyltrehalose trehalohydrolase
MTMEHPPARLGRIGAVYIPGEGVHFRQWAPEHSRMEVALFDGQGQPQGALPMRPDGRGFFEAALPQGAPGQLYKFLVDGEGPFPDPWSHAQPLGVHGPSQVVSHAFDWTDGEWGGVAPEDLVIYELHVGTATAEGTFDALIPRLDGLRELGVTAVELMPVASFPGERNWGYDGVALFAPQHSYGGPEGLKRLVDAAHARGLAVLIDAVYNHFGPDGNYLRCYASHYFTGRHQTPWGEAVNYDGEHAAVVRELSLRSAELWIRDYHADGLRLDAVHAIIDDSHPPLVQELAGRCRAAAPHRKVLVIAEDERNDARLVTPVAQDGWGVDGVWADDFHHQLRRAFAGDSDGYYADYTGQSLDLARTLQQGWFYEGQRSPTQGKARGTAAGGIEPWRLVHCIQNHDQIGNRAQGSRLGADVSPEAFRAMSALLLLSPYTPLLFMGQEWNASTPFLYFTSYEAELGRLVTQGRRKEFEHFEQFSGAEVPDPQAPGTFERSRLRWEEATCPPHAGTRALYRELLRLRREERCLRERSRGSFEAAAVGPQAVLLRRSAQGRTLFVLVNVRGRLSHRLEADARVLLWTEAPAYAGRRPHSPLEAGAVVLEGPEAIVYVVG